MPTIPPASARGESHPPLVTVIMPVRNEGRFIERTLGAILCQDYPHERLEVLVVDGDSSDETAAIASGLLEGSADLARAAVLPNPRRTAATAMNIGVREAKGDFVVRIDGHAVASPDYVSRCVELLQTTGYECVGGRVETVPTDARSRAISIAQSSTFGVGNVAWRTGRADGAFVDSLPFGAWPRRVFDEVGLFDEELVRNQDDELSFRIAQAGGRIWYDPSITAEYYSRATYSRAWQQYFEYGLYKIRVMQKRRAVAAGRHLVPGAFVAVVAAAAASTAATRRWRWFLGAVAPYAAANAVVSTSLALRHHARARDLALAFATLHFAYGSGTVAGLWRWRQGFSRGPRPNGGPSR